MHGSRAALVSSIAIFSLLVSCSDGSLGPKCVAGTAVACECPDGSYGASLCDANGRLDECQCDGGFEEPPPALCPPGATIDCLCSSVHVGEAVCTADGAAGACSCPLFGDCSGPVTGTSFILRLTRIDLPTPDDVLPIGLDLDGHYTKSASDPIGCGKLDLAEGIDNQLGLLVPIIEEIAGTGPLEPWLNAMVGVVGGFELELTVTGFDGVGDPGVRLDIVANGITITPTTGICASVDAHGVLRARIDEFPLYLPDLADGITLDLTLRDVTLVLPFSASGDVRAGTIAGGATYDDGEGGGIRGAVAALIDTYDAPLTIDAVDFLAQGYFDLGEPGACDTISAGLQVDLLRL
jgi:hypothetical protein